MATKKPGIKRLEKLPLDVGTKLFPLVDSSYHLSVTDLTDDALTLEDSRTGARHTATKGDDITIGRHPGNTVVASEKHVSREHGVIRFDRVDKRFVYVHNGRNPLGYERKDGIGPAHDVDDAQDGQTVTGLDGAGEMGARQAFELRPGMRLTMRYDIPAYDVVSDGKGIKLVSTAPDRDRYPAEFKIPEDGVAYIDRDHFPHMKMSRMQATVLWDEESREFILSNIGNLRFTLAFPKEFLKEQDALNQALQLPKAQAQEQLAEAKALKAQLEEGLSLADNAQRLEAATIVTPLSDFGGARTEDSQKGYEIWLRAYTLLNDMRLGDDEKAQLRQMADVIADMGENRAVLRDIETRAERIPRYETGNAGSYPYAQQMTDYTAHKMEQLERDGEVFLPTGFRGHHTVSRIRREEDGSYTLTTFNAGCESRSAPAGENPDGDLVMASYTQRILPGADIGELVTLLSEKKLRHSAYRDIAGYDRLCADIEAKLEPFDPARDAHHNARPQGKGNCTTRSTREMLRDELGTELFADMHRHISDPNVSNAQDIMKALDMRIHALEAFLDKGQDVSDADSRSIRSRISPEHFRRREDSGPDVSGSQIVKRGSYTGEAEKARSGVEKAAWTRKF